MNWRRIKTFAKVLVFGSFLIPTFLTLYNLTRIFEQYSEGETADSLQPKISRDVEVLVLLNSYLVPVFFFGVVLWIVAAGKLRQRTVNPSLGNEDDRHQ